MLPLWTCNRESERSRPRVHRLLLRGDSTTYTLTATGPGGTQSATARVTVTVPPPPPPPPPPAKEVTEDELFNQNVKDAYFDFDKATIRADAETALTGDAAFLKEHQSIKFTIEGKCDERGSEEYNLGLGDRRATAAKNYLVNAGVSADSIIDDLLRQGSSGLYGQDRRIAGSRTAWITSITAPKPSNQN